MCDVKQSNGRENFSGLALKQVWPERGFVLLLFIFLPGREWADPGSTAIPGQPVARAEQASDISPVFKNQFNIEVLQWGTYQILS